ncbi:GGDEF domain-containing protein [Halopseudomonas pachastrellae]|nr:GGDEF domain-containing protein [Halopseudomonas pachastrellae]
MHNHASQYLISAWRGEFVDAATEHAFRAHSEPLMARALRRAVLVWALLVVLFGALDYPALGWTAEFQVLFGWRLATGLILVFFYFQVRRKPALATAGYAVTAVEIFGSVLFFLLYFLRHDIVTLGYRGGCCVLAGAVHVHPQPGISVVAGCRFIIAGMLFCVAINGFGIETLVGLTFMLMLPTVVGFFTALRWQVAQRQHYALLMQVMTINSDLQSEVRRREALEVELKRQATTDPLTGRLFNRRQYEMLFQRERERCNRLHQQMSLCIMDLDHFKRINDEHGHDVGDAVLRHVAQQLSCSLRHSDVVGRFGGEEFVLVLPDTGLEQAVAVLNRLRED